MFNSINRSPYPPNPCPAIPSSYSIPNSQFNLHNQLATPIFPSSLTWPGNLNTVEQLQEREWQLSYPSILDNTLFLSLAATSQHLPAVYRFSQSSLYRSPNQPLITDSYQDMASNPNQSPQSAPPQGGVQSRRPPQTPFMPHQDGEQTRDPSSHITEHAQGIYQPNRVPAPNFPDHANIANHGLARQPQNGFTPAGYVQNSFSGMPTTHPTGHQPPEITHQYLQAIDNNDFANIQVHSPQNSAPEHPMDAQLRAEMGHRSSRRAHQLPSSTSSSVGHRYHSHYTHRAPALDQYNPGAGLQPQGPHMGLMNGHQFHSGFMPNVQSDVSYQALMQAHSLTNPRPIPHIHDQRYSQVMNTNPPTLPSQRTASHNSAHHRMRGRPAIRPTPLPVPSLMGPNANTRTRDVSSAGHSFDREMQLIMMQQELDAQRIYIEPIIKEQPKGLDNQNDGRPPPKETEDLTVNLECKSCMTQLIDTVMLPCGHACLCRWCADQHMPPNPVDKSRPKNSAACPMCRKPVRQKVRIYIA